jgi:hypothetical protein
MNSTYKIDISTKKIHINANKQIIKIEEGGRDFWQGRGNCFAPLAPWLNQLIE